MSEDIREFLDRKWQELPAELRAGMVEHLRQVFSKLPQGETVDVIRQEIARDPRTWWSRYHSFWGMTVRNELRRAGFTDHRVGGNLDDYYVQAVEEAVREAA